MNKNQTLKAMREIVRDLGRKCTWADANGMVHENYTLTLKSVILFEGDICTEVCIDSEGRLSIDGWDGEEGGGNYAENYSEEVIEKVYNAMLKEAA